jgi:hypothetical protein
MGSRVVENYLKNVIRMMISIIIKIIGIRIMKWEVKKLLIKDVREKMR